MKIYIFGMGKGKTYLDRCLLPETEICGYIDNYKSEEIGFFDERPVVSQKNLGESYDYIIITLMQIEEVKKSLLEEGIKQERLICFFDFKDASAEAHWSVIDPYKWRIELMWWHYTNIGMASIDNMGYELYADSELNKRYLPKIASAKETTRILKNERKSLARLGDGEFEMICMRPRPVFQDVNSKLAERLREVLNSHEDNLLVAIADNYGSLEKYTEKAASDIRAYMTKEVRRSHMELLDLRRQYYDAYISRPYIMYKDKENAKERFDWVREIWTGEDVLIVEGEHTRFGVGNNLLDNAKSVKRIIGPDRNAFNKYKEIKAAAYKHGKNKLILAILGPTATVLVYDLAKESNWVIDIGQFDVEYEWFLKKTEKRCGLKYRQVSEISKSEQLEMDLADEVVQNYLNEIVEKIL